MAQKKKLKYLPILIIFVLAIIFVIVFFLLLRDINPGYERTTNKPQNQLLENEDQSLEGFSLEISPIFINMVASPSSSASATFRVRNRGTETEELFLDILKFRANEDGTTPIPEKIAESDVFVNWISFSDDEFSLASGEQKNIELTINIPESANLGYYFGVQIARQNQQDDNVTGTSVEGAPMIPVLLAIDSPNAQVDLNIVDFKTQSPVYEYLPSIFEITIQNAGNIHTSPFGDIFIQQGNETIGTVSLNTSASNVLPDTQRTFTSRWEDGLLAKRIKRIDGNVALNSQGEPVYESYFDWSDLNKFRFGQYQARAIVVYNDGVRDIPIEAITSFWVIPWKLIILAIGIVFLILLGAYSAIRNFLPEKQ